MTSYCGEFQFTLMQMVGCNPSINPETGKGSFLFIHSVPSSIRQRQCKLGCSYRSLIHPGNNNTQANAVTLYAAPMRNPDAGNRTQAWTVLTQRGCLPLCLRRRSKSNTMMVQQIPTKPRRNIERKSILHPLCRPIDADPRSQAASAASSSSSAFSLHAAAEKPCATLLLTTRHLSLSYS